MSEYIETISTDDGCRLWTATTGSGEPIVLCHGGPGLWDYLGPVAAGLDNVGLVHRWDQRGGGRSSAVPPYTLDRFVRDLDVVRDQFGHDQWIVAGHSWGATLALEYALRHPHRTTALIYISGTGIGRGWRTTYHTERERRLRDAGALIRWNELSSRSRTPDEERELCVLTWMTDYIDPTFGRRAAEEMLSDGFLPNYDVNTALSNALDDEPTMIHRCAQLRAPALIIHGATDPRPPSAVDSLASALSNSQLHIIGHADHLPWTEQPATFREVLRDFIRSLPPS